MEGPRLHVAVALAAVVLQSLAGCQADDQAAEDPGPSLQTRLEQSLVYLLGLRGDDGRWDAGILPYVVEAADAAGMDLAQWPEPVPLAKQVSMPPADGDYLASLRPLLAVALVAAQAGDHEALGEVEARVVAGFDGRQFGRPELLNDDAFALIVLGHTGFAWPGEVEPAVRGLVANQSADGGWSWSVDGEGETDVTGIVLAGLAAAGALRRVDEATVLGFLGTTQGEGGGHTLTAGGKATANCDSTVWAIRVRALLDEPPDDAAWRFLLDLQQDGGGFAYLPGTPSNALCTAEAALLLAITARA